MSDNSTSNEIEKEQATNGSAPDLSASASKQPSKDQQIAALRWYKALHPDAAKAFPRLFDENNLQPRFFYMGLDLERMAAVFDAYPFNDVTVEVLSDLIYHRNDPTTGSEFSQSDMYDVERLSALPKAERDRITAPANHVEVKQDAAFIRNPIKETHRIIGFYMDALEAFGQEYFPKFLIGADCDDPEKQKRLFSDDDIKELDAATAAEVEQRRLKVWPDFHMFKDTYISTILLIGSMTIQQTLKLYEDNPDLSLCAKDANRAIMKLITGLPDNLSYPNDKVSAEVWSNSIKDPIKGAFVNIAARNKHPINMLVSINYDADNIVKQSEIAGGGKLSVFDRRVHDAVVTLIANGRNVFDVAQIWQVMNATTRNNMTPKDAAEIDNCLKNKLSRRITISPQGTYKGVRKGCKDYWGPLLMIEHIPEVEKQGRIVGDCYHVAQIPPLYLFAKAIGQVITAPMNMLKTNVNKTREIQDMQDYLLRRVKSKTQSTSIVIDTMLSEGASYDPAAYATPAAALLRRKRLIKYAKQILTDWTDQGEIEGYSIMKKGRKDYSFVIKRPK